MDCLNQQNLKKLKEAISLNVYKRNTVSLGEKERLKESFCENRTTKSFIIDILYCIKYTPEVVLDSKINLK